MNKTKRAQILDLIRKQPGITEAEIRSKVEINGSVLAYINPSIVRGQIIAESAEGTSATVFRESEANPLETDEEGNVVARRRGRGLSKSACPESPDIVDISISASGHTTITKGSRTIVMTPAETARVVAFLDRVNVDQILADVSK
ncbi:hypothetical protein WS72_13495 [Burkholderia savannae]|uniref:Transcriptional regulator n=1 Tax=Burkholderia savannae TaxID=1637837 RepID=A0ABR5TFT4_9BURK|nr:hypothetical protein [Burkholderia savannae]KWZ43770.1 hypothetical protein WS72_13495 [Burkholderia savannae]